MTEEQKKMAFAFVAGFAVGIGGCIAYRRWKVSRADNIVSSRPIPKELRVRPCEGGIFFGAAPPGKCQKAEKQCDEYCGKPADADGNVLVVGGPGSGKTTGVVYPTLGTWPGSIVALDCKGGMEGVWKAMHQNSNKKLFVFAPYRKYGGPCAYDPFAIMRQDPEHVIEHAWDLAESLIPIELSEREPVWKKSAQNALSGAFLYYFDAGKPFVEAIRSINGLSIPEIVDLIRKSGNEKAQAFVSKIYGASGKTMGSIGVELNEIPRMVMNQEIMDALTPAPDRPLLDWGRFNAQRESFDVILDIPGNKLKLYAPLIRMMITQLVKTLSLRREKSYSKDDLPAVLLMLDEFPQLGSFPAVVNALATLRSKGVTILVCAQSLAFLEAIYGRETTHTIMETCQYKMILNATDPGSQAYLSTLIGGADVASGSMTFRPGPRVLVPGITVGKQRRPLIYPEELAYLKNPIITSPYGVFEVEKICMHPKHTESTFRNDRIEERSELVRELKAQIEEMNNGHQHDELSSSTDCPCEEGNDTHSLEEAKKAEEEAVMDEICVFCKEPKSAQEITDHFGIAGREIMRLKYLCPLLDQGRLKMKYPNKPNHPNQKYCWAEDGTNSANTCAQLNIGNGQPEREEKQDGG